MKKLCARNLIAAVRDHFVGVHVGLCAASGLPYDQRKMLRQRAAYNLVAGFCESFKLLLRHAGWNQFAVGKRRGLLQDTEGFDNLAGHRLKTDTDRKIPPAPLGLCAPVAVCRHLDVAHGIMLNAILHPFLLMSSLSHEKQHPPERMLLPRY